MRLAIFYIASSSLLISSSINAKLEMSRFQTRILRIINNSPDIARTVYKIPAIKELRDKHCNNTLIYIIKDSEHPINKNIIRNLQSILIETRYRTNTSKPRHI